MDISSIKERYTTDIDEFLRTSKGKLWFIDTETTGFELYGKDQLYTLQVMDEHGTIGIFFNTENNSEKWEKLLNQPKRIGIFFNGKFDLNSIRKLIGHYPVFKRIRDAMVQYRLLRCEGKYALKEIARKLLNADTSSEKKLEEWKAEYKKKHKLYAAQMRFIPYDLIPPKILIPYALDDVILTAQIYFMTISELRKHGMMDVYNNEMKLLPILADMKWRGIRIDSEGAYRYKVSCLQKQRMIERKVWKIAGKKFNLNSNDETEEVMLKLGYKLKYSYNGNVQLDKVALARMKGDLPKLLSRYSSLDYEITHYLNPMSSCGGRLHTDLNQVGALTGRFSSYDPNLQNMYRGPRIRKFILPEPGCFLAKWDYSQIEMRLFAAFAKIRKMLEHFHNEHDLHEMAAIDCVGKCNKVLRQIFKTINFLIVYGGGAERLWFELQKQAILNDAPELLQIPYPRAAYFMMRYKETYPEIPDYFAQIRNELDSEGYIRNFYGRCYFPTSFFNTNTSYKGVNYVVQGSAADLIKRAMTKIESLSLPMKMVLQVHDELLYSVPEDEPFELMREEVENGMVNDPVNKLVPLKVDGSSGKDYGHLESLA